MSAIRPMFKRGELAASLARELAGETFFDHSSGLFLAAPRRTGKSTFLKNDLIPACKERDWLTVYVDLWVNRHIDPAELIAGAIGSALAEFESNLSKAAKRAGIEKISLLRTLSWDFSKPQLPPGTSLAKALDVLHTVSGQMVVLIIDEAQHALNSESGVNTMFALKAARDQLNSGEGADGVRMVFTGSSRDKLANLVLKNKQPFYGARITAFPLLDKDYVEFITQVWNSSLASNNQFAVEDVEYAFQLVGRRPEMLTTLLTDVRVILGEASNLGELLRVGALTHRAGVWSDYESACNDLSPLQLAVLEVIAECAESKESFVPYSEQTLNLINRKLELAQQTPNASKPNVQKAIDMLRERELVWKANHGEYALEDTSMASWLATRNNLEQD